MRFAIVLKNVSIFNQIQRQHSYLIFTISCLWIGDFVRPYRPQVIFHSGRSASNSLYTFKSQGKIDKAIIQSHKIFICLVWRRPLFSFFLTPHPKSCSWNLHSHFSTCFLFFIFIFVGNRAYGGRCTAKSKWLSWDFSIHSRSFWVLEGFQAAL